MSKYIKPFRNIIGSGSTTKKTIMNMFICYHESPNWYECVDIVNTIKFPTSVEISPAHHRGLGIQVLLDTNLEDSKKFCESIIDMFPEKPLIVLSEVNVVIKDEPIGWYNDKDLTNPGRYFDKLVRENKKGIYVL
jgi:hypothetical protein